MAKLVIQAHEGADRDDTAIRRFLKGMPIFHLLGVKAVHFEAGKGELELPWRKYLTHDGTTIPAAVSATPMDFAGGAAVATLLPRGSSMMTTGSEVHNIAPAVGERRLAYGETISLGKAPARSARKLSTANSGCCKPPFRNPGTRTGTACRQRERSGSHRHRRHPGPGRSNNRRWSTRPRPGCRSSAPWARCQG